MPGAADAAGSSIPPTTRPDTAEWLRLLRADQIVRWQRGDRLLVEAFLEREPTLQTSPEALLDLLANEIALREGAGESVRLDEYLERFPDHAASLQRQFALRQTQKGEESRPASEAPSLQTLPQDRQSPAGPPEQAWVFSPEDRPDTLPDSAATSSSLQRTAPLVMADYEILEEVGRGGIGIVYKARHVPLNRLVALKMLLAGVHASASEVVRFRGEAEAVARLQHPNIVNIYDVGEWDNRPYLALEFVEGGSLDQKLRGVPQPPRPVAQFMETLARAIHTAHLHGIVHRDLKPANILISAESKDGPLSSLSTQHSALDTLIPKVTDFGLAKRLEGDSGLTQSGAVVGTPSYMAPEQALGRTEDVGPLSDVYALGAILYEMLAGRPPFRGATVHDTLEQVRSQEPVPLRRLQGKVPRDLETICMKCLQKEPRKRYPSAEALAEDLRHFLNQEPIQARPVGQAERLWRWCRRNPRVAALSTAVLLLLGTLLVGSVVTAFSMTAARDRAEQLAQQARTEQVKAETARDQTRREAQKAQTVSNYLVDLFKVPDPFGFGGFVYDTSAEQGSKLTAKEILERGREKVDRELKELPLLRAEVLDGIGTSFRSLGLYREARPLLEEALRIRRQQSGVTEAELANSLYHLGWLYHTLGDYTQGESLYRDALDLRRRCHADDLDHPEVVTTLTNLARARLDQGRTDGVEPLLQEALTIFKGYRAVKHSVMAETLKDFARYYLMVEYPEAAAARALECRALWPRDREILYSVASQLARCAALASARDAELAGKYAGQSLETLQQAIAQGFKEGQRLRQDSAWNTLRPRADFQKLLADLEAKGKATEK